MPEAVLIAAALEPHTVRDDEVLAQVSGFHSYMAAWMPFWVPPCLYSKSQPEAGQTEQGRVELAELWNSRLQGNWMDEKNENKAFGTIRVLK